MPRDDSTIQLPPAPEGIAHLPVRAWQESVEIDTYAPGAPDRYPAYLDQRVYQGSSGAVYPLPFIESVSQDKAPRRWAAVHLENEYVRIMVLPELGGRVHVGIDTTRGYDFFYRNDVIKPALVGLAGPWISGGLELNWPQHHRPATFLPCEVSIEHEPDGAVTVWCSDHDPFARMQGMHGLRLRPGSSVLEVRGHLVNRTDDVQTFLWWANAAVAVNDDYQSFFPTDVHVVADHAKRAISTFPAAQGSYYGVDYPARRTPERPDGDRLDWYRTIPVPTSFMCLGSQDDFFGGYDHGARAGTLHWADHRVAPGKKQWTWGDAPFGHAWGEHLTDTNGPYVELMAGVFTDNQPDFAFLKPGETKTFSQYWYPFQEIGPVHQATRDVAVRLDVVADGAGTAVRIGVAATSRRPGTRVLLRADAAGAPGAADAAHAPGAAAVTVHEAIVDLAPDAPYVHAVTLDGSLAATACELVVEHDGTVLLTWRPRPVDPGTTGDDAVQPATEPRTPEQIGSVDELYVTGVHLAQYRHATRSPEPYWQEALRRDPGDVRSHVALAARRQHDGRLDDAERHLGAATARLVSRNPNPRDGEAHYRLGLVLARQGRVAEAADALATARWDQAWADAATVAAVRLDLAASATGTSASAGSLARATEDLHALLLRSPQHTQARNLAAVAARRRGDLMAARALVRGTLAANPLDAWARDLAVRLGALGGHGEQGTALEVAPTTTTDPTIALDVAREYLSVGEDVDAVDLLDQAIRLPLVAGQPNVAPLALLYRADLALRRGDAQGTDRALAAASALDPTWCFPSTLDNDLLARLRAHRPHDPLLAALQGHWLYAAGRGEEAIAAWETAVREAAATGAGADPVVLRNLGIAAHNVGGDPALAERWYAQARAAAPDDARLLLEADQLAGRLGRDAAQRSATLLSRPDLVAGRDDLTVQLAELLTLQGQAADAVDLLAARRFQPWEGGEGRVLTAWEEAHLHLAREALDADPADPGRAIELVTAALQPPASLGEARHPLASTAELRLLLGDALAASGRVEEAREAWMSAADQQRGSEQGDVQTVATQDCSEAAASVTALRRLGRREEAERLRDVLARYVAAQTGITAQVDYFATSLPTMLLFTEDLQATHDARVQVLTDQLAALDSADNADDDTPTPSSITVTDAWIDRDGAPWMPITGEIHYSRLPRERWSEVLGHARAGGLTSVATYVLWQAHEPAPGDFRWDGNIDLRAFIELAARHGLDVVVRTGPWAHGEARYGGFPDWLIERDLATRTNDPAYLALVRAYFAQIAAQLEGLGHADGGPIIAFQMDNELYDQPEHLARLREIAEELGLRAPIWTATGWGGAQVPDTLLPVYSAYADGFWEDETTEWPAFSPTHFRYSVVRDDLSVGADLREALDGVVLDPAALAVTGTETTPYVTCELGGGMHVAYHRRPLVTERDVAGVALAKLGSGSVWQGYYMYAGGTQRVGARGTEQESQATGYPNDVPTRTYDFHAPVGEHGQIRAHHHLLRRQHLWLHEDGHRLAAMATRVGGGSDDPGELRWSVRSDGTSGYLFLTTYQPDRSPLLAQAGVQLTLAFDDGSVAVPAVPLDLPAGVSLVWPLRYPLTPALVLRSATAQVLTRITDDDGDIVVLAATTGVPVELVLDGDVPVSGAATGRRAAGATVLTLTEPAGPGCLVHLPGVRVLVLGEADADRLYRLEVGGRDRLVLSDAPVYALDGALVVHPGAATSTVWMLPAPTGLAVDTLDTPDTANPADPALLSAPRDAGPWRTWTLHTPTAGTRPLLTELHPTPQGPVPAPTRGGPMHRLSAPTDSSGAAQLHVGIPAAALAGADRALLRITWTGDVGRAWIGDELVSDHFWHGRVWDVDLTPWAREVAEHGVRLELTPWHAAHGIWVDPSVRDVPDGVHVTSIEVVRVARAILVAS